MFKRINVDAKDITEKFLESLLNIIVGIFKFILFVLGFCIWSIALIGIVYFYL